MGRRIGGVQFHLSAYIEFIGKLLSKNSRRGGIGSIQERKESVPDKEKGVGKSR